MSTAVWLRRFSGPAALVISSGGVWLVAAPTSVVPRLLFGAGGTFADDSGLTLSRGFLIALAYAFASASALYASGWALWFRRPWGRVLFLIAEPLCLPAVNWLGRNALFTIGFASTALWLYVLASGREWRSVVAETGAASQELQAPPSAALLSWGGAGLAMVLMASPALLARIAPSAALAALALSVMLSAALTVVGWKPWNRVAGTVVAGAGLVALVATFALGTGLFPSSHLAMVASTGLPHEVARVATAEVLFRAAVETAIPVTATLLVLGIPFALSPTRNARASRGWRIGAHSTPVLASTILISLGVIFAVIWRAPDRALQPSGESQHASSFAKPAVSPSPPPPPPPPSPRPKQALAAREPAAVGQPAMKREPVTPAVRERLASSAPLYMRSDQLTVVKRVAPRHPERLRGRSGAVALELVIGIDGRVLSARSLRGDADLAQAAIDAAKLWEFAPNTINGEPAVVKTLLTFNFRSVQ